MKFVVAPDSFKGSLSAAEAAVSMKSGILRVYPDAEVVVIPIADGGEGMLDAVAGATNVERVSQSVTGPLGDVVEADYLVLSGDPSTAIVEMAQAAGLHLVAEERRNPALTTTFGVGQLIAAAVHCGCKKVIVGLGGSCTNDCGAGAMQSLGIRFLDSCGELISSFLCGEDLLRVYSVDCTGLLPSVREASLHLASDVTNPLIGPNGASKVFGPQKGATVEQVELLDRALAHFSKILLRDLGVDVSSRPGGGAAGGLGAGLMAFLGAKMTSGIDVVLDLVNFDSKVSGADYVFTGEGRIDRQTLSGKAISGVLLRCRRLCVPVVAFGGSVDQGMRDELVSLGAVDVISISNESMEPSYSIRNTGVLLEEAVCKFLSK